MSSALVILVSALATLNGAYAQYGSAASCNVLAGGASSFAQLGPAILAGVAPVNKVSPPPYASSSSGTGISNFITGAHCTAVSDDPMTAQQDLSFKTGSGNTGAVRLTLPLVIASYGFFYNDGNNTAKSTTRLQLTYNDTFNMYRFGGAYSTFKYATGTTGKALGSQSLGALAGKTILPYSRSGNSGTTLVIKKFWQIASGLNLTRALLNVGESDLTGTQFNASWATSKYVQGSGTALCAAVAAKGNVGAMGYSQKNLCLPPTVALLEVQLMNAAGKFIQSSGSTADPTQAVPRQPPTPEGSWATVVTVMVKGDTTPPIVSFEYGLARRNYRKTNTNAAFVKNWLLAAVRVNPKVATSFGFTALSSNYSFYTQTLNAINSIALV